MNILYVYAHPNPASLNAALKQTALETLTTAGNTVTLTDLYAQHFKPAADARDFTEASDEQQYFLAQLTAFKTQHLADDINTELKKIAAADHIILQFPLWWFSVPAIMKGWLDRVLVKGFAYDTGKMFADGLLRGKTASFTVTTQSPEAAYQKDGVHGAELGEFLLPVKHALRLAGVEVLEPFVVFGAFELEAEKKEEIIRKYQEYLKELMG